jgi:hypothetical protein
VKEQVEGSGESKVGGRVLAERQREREGAGARTHTRTYSYLQNKHVSLASAQLALEFLLCSCCFLLPRLAQHFDLALEDAHILARRVRGRALRQALLLDVGPLAQGLSVLDALPDG